MRSIFSRLGACEDIGPQSSAAALLLILLLVGVRSVLHAIAKPFYIDELFTLMISRLPSAAEIWRVLGQGPDGQPPFFYLVEHVARQLIPDDHLGYRALSILSTLITISCVYIVLSRRVSRLSALVGASLLLYTPVAGYYATEARPYALVAGCFSVAILAWQRIDDSKFYALAVAAALACASSLHYYAILYWPVFLMAELSIWVFKCRLRWSALTAIIAGALPAVIDAPLLLRLRQTLGAHLPEQLAMGSVLLTYNFLFDLTNRWGPIVAIGITFLLLTFNNRADAPSRSEMPDGGSTAVGLVSVEEATFAVMLLWMPLGIIAVAKIGGGQIAVQYMLPAALGGVLAAGYLIERTPVAARSVLLFLFLLGYTSAWVNQLKNEIRGSLLGAREEIANQLSVIAENTHDGTLPVVVADGQMYATMAYYTPSPSNNRLYYIAEPDSADYVWFILSHCYPLQIDNYAGFLSAHRQFLLATDRTWVLTWLPQRLMDDGNTVQLIWALPGQQLEVFKVTVRR